jgi:quercetin dioxygenase-like cupin family protein
MKMFLVAAALIAFASSAVAQDAMKVTKVTPDALTWKDNPAFPKGIQIATLVGDPTKPGEVVVLRIKFQGNAHIPPHTHPYGEVVTLISGTIATSEGEKFEKKGEMLKARLIVGIPGKTRALCLDRKRGGDHPGSIHQPRSHRLYQPG